MAGVRPRWIYGVMLGAMLSVVAGLVAAAQDRDARIVNVRFGLTDNVTRLVLDADRPLAYDYFPLTGDAPRLVIDLPNAGFDLPGAEAGAGAGYGLGGIASFRFARHDPEVSRLVLDLSQPLVLVNSFDLPPSAEFPAHRLVFDFETVSPAQFADRAQAYRDARQTEMATRHSDPLAGGPRKFTIVIDPGHGGRDPGALGGEGTLEKAVNLAAGLELRDLLVQNPRYEVILTRQDDVYIDLFDRVRFARDVEADLFISLHADAAGNRTVAGASVYTLNSKGERRVDRVAEENDWHIPLETEPFAPEVGTILVDFVKRETKSNSALFSHYLIEELALAGPVLRNTHRQANLAVLLAPDVPAVLLELGFMTNREDEARLRSTDGRARAVNAVAAAIDRYYETHVAVYAQR